MTVAAGAELGTVSSTLLAFLGVALRSAGDALRQRPADAGAVRARSRTVGSRRERRRWLTHAFHVAPGCGRPRQARVASRRSQRSDEGRCGRRRNAHRRRARHAALAAQRGAKTIILSHLGRPDGKPNPKYSLRPVAARSRERLGTRGAFVDDCVGPAAVAASRALPDGGFVLFENVRFHAEEEANDPAFARELAQSGDLYVNDAFGTAHRAHASTVGVAGDLPAYAGLLMEAELAALARLTDHPGKAVRMCDRRREGRRQSRRVRELARAGRCVRDRRRNGEHVSRRAGHRRRARRCATTISRRRSRSSRCAVQGRHPAPAHRRRRRRRVRCRRDGAHRCARSVGDGMILDIGPATARAYADGAARREDDRLQRADGRVRKSAVSERHARRSAKRSRKRRRTAPPASSAAATRPRRRTCSASRTR